MMEEKQREIVREELERVLASPRLAGTPRLAGFLRLVVEMSLDGREEEIKEYLIGTEVYRRGVNFDPKVDSIVRVEAYRLRARLEEYYGGLESPPAVRIELTKGTYVPRFHFQRNDSAAPIAEPLATAPATRRRWLAWAGAGTLGAAGAGGWLYWRGGATQSAAIHLHSSGGEASPAGAFRLRLAHQLGRLLPHVELSAAENIHELRAGDGLHSAVTSYALILCGEATEEGRRFCVAAEAGATATEITTQATLAEHERSGLEAAAGQLARQIASAVRQAGSWDRQISAAARRDYLEVIGAFRRGRDSLLLTSQERETPWPLDEILQGIARLQAVAKAHPRFAAAWAQQAWLCSLASSYDRNLFDRAAEAARRALEIDARVWKAHFNLGYVQFFHQQRFREAAESIGRAMALAPLRLEIVRYYADSLAIAGRAAEAWETLRILLTVIPRHRLARLAAAALAYHRHDFSGMLQLAETTMTLEPGLAAARWQRALAREQLGNWKDAEQDLREVLREHPDDRRSAAALAHLLAAQSRRSEAWRLAESSGLSRSPYLRALIHAGGGETAQALDALRQSLNIRESGVPYFAADPRFAALRETVGGRQLLTEMLGDS
jgi:tetratricopeptide (TPR) repeat protein